MKHQDHFNFTFPLPNGLHARPAAFIEEAIREYECDITIINNRNNRQANTASVLSMIASDILINDVCTVVVSGEKSSEEARTFKAFLTGDFLHCDPETRAMNPSSEGTPLPCMLRDDLALSSRGICVSAGIGQGKLIHVNTSRLRLTPEAITKASIAEEKIRFLQAKAALCQTLERQLTSASHEQLEVIKAHLALVQDQQLTAEITECIANHASILHAILTTQAKYSEQLASSSSQYLRERVYDIQDVCAQLIEEVYGKDSYDHPDTVLTEDSICVASHLTPSQFLSLDRRLLKGLVLGEGSETSHTIILARSFGIPVVSGLDLSGIGKEHNEAVILDAHLGLLICTPSQQVQRYYALEHQKTERVKQRRSTYITRQTLTREGVRIEVAANIASAHETEAAFACGAEGIGLFRTEMLYMDRDQPPAEQELYEAFRKTLSVANGRPVIIRTMDIGGDKPVAYFDTGQEENPFLGYRGVRIYPEYLSLFKDQLRALLRASAHGPCKIMVPMVSSLTEARWLRETFNEVMAELREAAMEFDASTPLGIMLEVPSCALIIDQLAQCIDFFSIGSNDLVQYYMAADRGNKRVQPLHDALNPSVLRLLKHIVDQCRKAGRWVGLCGEMAGSSRNLPLLVGLGLNEVSMGGAVILESKECISHLSAKSCRLLVEQAIMLETGDEVNALLDRFHSEGAEQPMLSEQTIMTGAQCQSKAEVIKTLIDNLELDGRLVDRHRAEEAVWDREAVSPTMLGFGIAIPHCKADSIKTNSISIMKLKTPILWNEGDEQLTDTVFMLNVRASDAGSMHMKIFAQLSRRIMRPVFRRALAECKNSQALLEFIHSEIEF